MIRGWTRLYYWGIVIPVKWGIIVTIMWVKFLWRLGKRFFGDSEDKDITSAKQGKNPSRDDDL